MGSLGYLGLGWIFRKAKKAATKQGKCPKWLYFDTALTSILRLCLLLRLCDPLNISSQVEHSHTHTYIPISNTLFSTARTWSHHPVHQKFHALIYAIHFANWIHSTQCKQTFGFESWLRAFHPMQVYMYKSICSMQNSVNANAGFGTRHRDTAREGETMRWREHKTLFIFRCDN